VGPGGIGKTWLAQQVASRCEARRTSVVAVDLEGVRRAEDALRRIARGLGLSEASPARVRRALAARAPLLLWLDDLDMMISEAAELLPVMGGSGVTALVTCREPLGLPIEEVLRVEPLPMPESRWILQSLAREAGAREEVLAAEAVEAVCAATEGIPLALKLVAPWLAMLPPGEVAVRTLALPALAPDDLPERHRGLMSCMARSWATLEPQARIAMSALCAVPGPLPLQAFERVLGERALEQLAQLRRRSWLTVQPDGRVRVLASIRAMVASQTPPELAAEAVERLYVWVREAARGHLSRLWGAEHADAMEALEQQLLLMQEVAELVPSDRDWASFVSDLVGAELLIAVSPRCLERLERALREAQGDPWLTAWLLYRRAQHPRRAPQEVLADLRAALALACQGSDRELQLRLRKGLGLQLALMDAPEQAACELDLVLEQAGDLPGLWGRAAIDRAIVDRARGDWAGSLVRLHQVEALARRIGDRHLEMLVLGSIARCQDQLGHPLEAEVALRRGLDAAVALRAPLTAAQLRFNLAYQCVGDSRLDEGVRLLKAALEYHQRHGSLLGEASALHGLAVAELGQGRLAQASRLATEAREAYRAAAYLFGEGMTLALLGRLEHCAARPRPALRRYEEALAILAAGLDRGLLGQTQALAAMAAAEVGQRARARELAEAARSALGSAPRGGPLLELLDAALSAGVGRDSAAWADVRTRLSAVDRAHGVL
jgi:tetratricopeptide (TPR) repeat protein